MRTRIVFSLLVVIGLTFYLVTALTVNLTGTSLLQDTARTQMGYVSALAVSLEEQGSLSAEDLYRGLNEAARRNGGRLLALDTDGKVLGDTDGLLWGQRMTVPEVTQVLYHGSSADYGYHKSEESADGWDGYFVSALLSEDGRIAGAVVRIVSVQETMAALHRLRTRLLVIFFAALAVIVLAAMLILRMVTRPVRALSEGINRMAAGDFDARVRIRGKDEMAMLAAAFNQMSEQVKSLDSARNDFVSSASHELRTPLTTMKILLESVIYEEDMEPEVRREFLGDIDKEIDRLSEVISDLLTLVHIDSNKLKLKREEMYLGDVVRESAQRLEPLAKKKEQTLNVEIQDECEMLGDPGKLGEVCYNIIGNAVKYTGEGGRIDVKLVQNGRNAVLSVADNGAGIPEADLPHIFERFYRVDKARTRQGDEGGTGLGLSIVRQMVRLHGGTVTAASKEGEGATFTVMLPIGTGGQA